VTVSIGSPPPPKSRSQIVTPPWVEDADHTIRPLCTSIIWRLTETMFAEVAPDLTLPYSRTTPVITASTSRIVPSCLIWSVEGPSAEILESLDRPRATSPGGRT
jgi:hypothetical protein